MRRWFVGAVALLAPLAPSARAELDRVDTLLRAVEEQAHAPAALRADGELTVASPDETRRLPVILLYRPSPTPGGDLYIELGNNAGKALILADGAQAFQLVNGIKQAEPFAADAALAGSEFSREDLEPFHTADFGDVRISDENPSRMTVSIVPKRSQYSLLVATIDREKKVLLKILYYRDTVSNLVKMQRDEEYVRIAGRWLPTTITMEDFKLRTQSTLKLAWKENPPIPPELFNPASLAKPSGLQW